MVMRDVKWEGYDVVDIFATEELANESKLVLEEHENCADISYEVVAREVKS
jgi:hypothetical protein